MTHSAFRTLRAHSAFRIAPLLLAWLGYFAPWLWPVPAALRLSGYDLVEWMTFAESVRNGTYPITRLDLLWPLTGIALLTALLPSPRGRGAEGEGELNKLAIAIVILLSLFASYLILPAYPFILTAPADPELRPQLILGLVTGLAALFAAALARRRPHWTPLLSSLISLISLFATVRAFLLIRQPLADILTHPAPVGFGFYVAVIGFGLMAVTSLKFVAESLRGGRRKADQEN